MSRQDSYADALARARAFTGMRNADWTAIIVKLGDIDPATPLPEMEMCLVPVGTFMMGNDSEAWYFDEQDWVQGVPSGGEQEILHPYWIARYPVTNAQWKQAVRAGIVAEPVNDVFHGANPHAWYRDPAMASCPVVGIEREQARQFAAWAKCSLPTEVLWEYAARGVESWFFPWGNDWEAGKRVIWAENSGGKPHPVTSKPEGASWVGAQHLSGNVYEWQQDGYRAYPYQANRTEEGAADGSPVLRGGAWRDLSTSLLRAAFRLTDPDDTITDWGVRCLRVEPIR
jgi:formylglycine-generating enzyme required for sulfatase activity